MSSSISLTDRPSEDEYHVFLSYSRRDVDLVTQIATKLRDSGITVWFDQWNMKPGVRWQSELQRAIVCSRAIAVVIGPEGVGPWEEPEMEAAINRSVERKSKVIPVLLPGVKESDDRIPLLLRNYHSCVIDGQVSQSAVDRLIWGITDRNPLQERTQEYQVKLPASGPNLAQVAIDSLAKHLIAGNVTFFFGRSVAHPCCNGDVATKLLTDLGLIEKEKERDERLLPPLDLVASFFAVKHGDADLEDQVVDIMSRRGDCTPAAYLGLARLQKVLATRAEIRGRKQFKQLIVSNNLDLLLEKTLLQEGLPFTRIVQYRSSSKAQINTVTSVQALPDGTVMVSGPEGRPLVMNPRDEANVGAVVSKLGTRTVAIQGGMMCDEKTRVPVSLSDLVEPILYKLHGSQDVGKTCAISTEQYFDTLWRSIDQKCVPDGLAEILSNTPVVLLGSRILDADFLLSYTLLRASLESGTDQTRFAIVARGLGDDRDGSQKIAKRAWDELSVVALKKYSIQMLDEREDLFFSRLVEAFVARR